MCNVSVAKCFLVFRVVTQFELNVISRTLLIKIMTVSSSLQRYGYTLSSTVLAVYM
ncbi:hypothetical protein VCRA2122O12_70086 [Vibrio crassostreae]|nr:hypothetical protein VCRA2122O10_20090 [Vibrio crassostreae]CAK3589927.1 hypothetical protein VCRA2122O12_70086 [Vibrio crassostreae]CAK3979240.1 hypothetical protein VCRA2120E7_80086 [Vibrio crassostreae]CAK3979885.1 hypothetical protein VCRA2120O6_90090 [Vibrio crassostreae]